MPSNFAYAITLFNNQFYLQVDGTATCPHMSCYLEWHSYVQVWSKFVQIWQGCCVRKDSEIMYLCYKINPWKSWINFFYFIHSINTDGKIKFTMPVANEYVLELLYLNWYLIKQKTSVFLFMSSLRIALLTYVLYFTCYPKKGHEQYS